MDMHIYMCIFTCLYIYTYIQIHVYTYSICAYTVCMHVRLHGYMFIEICIFCSKIKQGFHMCLYLLHTFIVNNFPL